MQNLFLNKFIQFNKKQRLASAKKQTLLAVSGGMDSIVMCHLFAQAGYPFAIAHCNFKLRGNESDGDEQFVKDLGAVLKVEVLTKSFDTEVYAQNRKISIQLAARELRYEWFEALRKEMKFNLVATAHHLNDNLETVLYNLVKGTGIRGLRGIPLRQGNIIRPMLFATRQEVEEFLTEHKLTYRQDSSNEEDKYSRNKIRHNVIPALKEINPGLEHTLGNKIQLFGELEEMYEREIKKQEKQLFLPRRGDFYIPIAKLKKIKHAESALFEFLKTFDFTASQVTDILQSVDSEAGKQFVSAKARIIKDRRFFILTHAANTDATINLIEETDSELIINGSKLQLSVQAASDIKITSSKDIALLDKSKLHYPLILRHWKQGDYFYPFGMKMKKKKLKKFFVDEKVPLHEKENIRVLESDGKIVWVVGHRIDERFKITANTKEVYRIKIS
ncbi:MAG: tRNA lysidine(34) synthetase TilS [Chitinophagales bacterium]